MTSVGTKIKWLRAAQELSRERLAARANCSAQTILRIERGTAIPKLDTVERIAAALGVPLADLFS